VVSGRTTPTWRLLAPLVPAAASDLNWSIVDAMSTVKELMLSPAGTVAEPLDAGVDELAEVDVDGVLEDDELLDDEHPAAAKETSAAVSPTHPSPRTPRDLRLPCEWEDRPPSVLKPSPIPNIPSLERARMARCGDTIQHRCPVEEEARAAARTSAITASRRACAAGQDDLADTEYNGVLRSCTRSRRRRQARDQIRLTRPRLTGVLAEIIELHGETFPLTHS